jgi:hypothetical protein
MCTCASRLASCAPTPCASHGRTRPTSHHVRPAPRASCHALPTPRVALPHARVDLYWAATSRWACVATVCFMHFRCMLYVFHLNVIKVNLVLLISQWLYTCVASVCFKCFNCFKHTLQTGCCIYCKGCTGMLQVCISNVSAVSSTCCMFSSECCICCSGYIRMFQVYI